MPRPVFDIEQYELRGIEPEVFTKEQRTSLRKSLARTHGQIDWTAQLLGFNGPEYWGRANPKSDHTYNWVGLPETMNEKRQMQTGAFGVYAKDQSYDQWPAPFNRSEVKASADQKFHIWEKGGATVLSPLGLGEGLDYLDDPMVIVGGSYVFDSEIEIEILYGGDQTDSDPSVSLFVEYDEGVWTRLNVERHINGSITVKKKGSDAKPLALRVVPWEDISDWNLPEVYKQYVGCWGNKGNQLSTDFLFDSLSLHACEEHYSLRQVPRLHKVTLDELFALTGLEPTQWTGLYPEKFMFRVTGCESPIAPIHPIQGNGIGNPWYGTTYWPPQYVNNREEMGECVSECNHWVKGWQTFEDELYDNGEFPAFCPENPTHIHYDNDTFANAPQPETLLDDYEYNEVTGKGNAEEGFYNRFAEPLDPNACDDEWNFKQEGYLDNGTFEDLYVSLSFGIEYEAVDEGIYDRIPFSGMTGFEFTWEALTAQGILSEVCISWIFDSDLDNGTLEQGYHNLFPPNPAGPNGDFWEWSEGPFATANDGVYDEVQEKTCSLVATTEETACNPDTYFCGYDDGEFDDWSTVCECEELPTDPNGTETCYNEGCAQDEEGDCTADGGEIRFSGMPDYEDCECEVECCEVDNEVIPPPPPYTGPDIVDGNAYTDLCSPADPPPNITYCDNLNLKWVRLTTISDQLLDFIPSVNNTFYPLRMWKNQTMVQTDTVPAKSGHHEYRNFLVADANRGAEPEDSYRSFVRLPAEYKREGKEWNRATQVCNNQLYFSSPPKLNEIDLVSQNPQPNNYFTAYRKAKKDAVQMYHEDYLYSDAINDFSEAELGGFQSAVISHEEPRPIAYLYGDVSEFEHLRTRKTDAFGEWFGSYYRLGPNPKMTGHLSTDLESNAVIPVEQKDYPVFDESEMKRPNITFPEENPLVSEKNYLVGYAYFTADMSASEEAVFEPTFAHCWRNTQIDNDVEKDGECVYDPIVSNTAYLLHPTQINNGKRTREARLPGETSKAQGTYELPSDGSLPTNGSENSRSRARSSEGSGAYSSPGPTPSSSPSPSGGGYSGGY